MADDGKEKKGGEERVRTLITGGAELAGGAIGGALGFLAGGPIGAAGLGAGGVAAGKALMHVGDEIAERMLGPREKVRVGGVLAMAANGIAERIGRGEQIRTDGFFDEGARGRSNAQEVAESILLKSQREPEERKLPYIAKLFTNVAFDQNVSAEMAHQLTKTAEQLTYRQLCILRLVDSKNRFGLRAGDYRGQGTFPKSLYQVLYECLDLYVRGLVNFSGDVAFGPTDVKPGAMTVQALGADLYRLMELDKISDSDLIPIATQLR